MDIITCVVGILISLCVGVFCTVIVVIADFSVGLAIGGILISLAGMVIWANNLRLALELRRLRK